MEDNETAQIVPIQSPQGLYLLGLGKAIANLCPAVTNGHWFNEDKQYNQRKDFVDDLHKKAMEVIRTLNPKNE